MTSPSISRRDFFISYNSHDKDWASWIAWTLEANGYSTIIQEWDFRPGSNFVIEMQKAATLADRTIAVLSSQYINALFTQPEWAAAFVRDPMGEARSLIPVLVADTAIPGLLAPIAHIRLVKLSERQARDALLAGLRATRSKPSHAPPFPGPP